MNWHYCSDGSPVVARAIEYKQTRSSDAYILVKEYYDNFREYWYKKMEGYMDRSSFNNEFDFKLCKALDTFKIDVADEIAAKKGYSRLGAFNGWLYSILAHWLSNVKSAHFRAKKRPPVHCPVCGRWVPRIDQDHLQHIKTLNDLPKFFERDGVIYETQTAPKAFAISWGNYSELKMDKLLSGSKKTYSASKMKVKWPFFYEDKKRGVVCPFTGKIVPAITNEYIKEEVPQSDNRFAEPISWMDFEERYSKVLIQSEIYSVDDSSHGDDDGALTRDHLIGKYVLEEVDHNNVDGYANCVKYEHAFSIIKKHVDDEVACKILQLIAIGYTVSDISDSLGIEKADIRKKIKSVRESCSGMKMQLINV